jgi:carboxymethylenebutenolidase
VEIVYTMVSGYPLSAILKNLNLGILYTEHIWWDQASVLRQAGILPSFLPFPVSNEDAGGVSTLLRLPVVGVESAHMLLAESKGRSNEMLSPEWGIKRAQ